MNSGAISNQALSLVKGQVAHADQNQGLWQRQLEQASLWQTNLSIASFKSRYGLPQPGSQHGMQSMVRHLPPAQSNMASSKNMPDPCADISLPAALASPAAAPTLHSAERRSQVLTAPAGALLHYSAAGEGAANKEYVPLLSPRCKPLLLDALTWQKQHIFMSDIKGVKQLWIRDQTVTKEMSAKLAASLLGSMSQLGVELSSLVVNGQLVFANDHQRKE